MYYDITHTATNRILQSITCQFLGHDLLVISPSPDIVLEVLFSMILLSISAVSYILLFSRLYIVFLDLDFNELIAYYVKLITPKIWSNINGCPMSMYIDDIVNIYIYTS